MRNLRILTRAENILALADRAREWNERLRLVREAREFIFTSTYFIGSDAYGVTFLHELTRAARRGAAVRLLIDSFGQKLAESGVVSPAGKKKLRGLFSELTRAGGEVAFYAPAHAVEKFCGSGNHVKIQVNDRGEAIFGSSNVAELSFESWAEFSVLLKGPVVADLKKIFLDLWSGEKKFPLPGDFAEDPVAGAAGGDELELFYANPCENSGPGGPFGDRRDNLITRALAGAIDGARASVDIVTLYFKPQKDLLNAVLRAAARGVRVRALHSHKNSIPTTELPWIPSYLEYARLLKHGVEIYEQRPGQHAKIVLIDGERAAFGSYNFEHAADDRLGEAMFVTRDPRFVTPLRDFLRDNFASSGTERVTRAAISRLPIALKMKSLILSPASRWI